MNLAKSENKQELPQLSIFAAPLGKGFELARFWLIVVTALGFSHLAFFREHSVWQLVTFLALAFLLLSLFALQAKNQTLGALSALILIAISALFIGTEGGGFGGITSSAVFWPLLLGLFTKNQKIEGAILTILLALIFAIASHFGVSLNVETNLWLSYLTNSISLCLLVPIAIQGANGLACADGYLNQLAEAKEEARLARSAAIERTRFIAEMSHEIRTPLNAILGFSDIMREGLFGKLSPQYHEYMELIHQSGKHLLDLVGDLLDMSKIEAGRYILRKAEVDLPKIAKDAIRILSGSASRGQINLEYIGASDLVLVADEKSLRQIFLNLLSNAIKFTPAGGNIEVRLFDDDSTVWIEVCDTGRGMGADELKRIGEPYLSADNTTPGARGTGLGLALVRTLVEMHDGKFEVTSTIGEGTEVSIELPKKEISVTQISAPSANAAITSPTSTI